MQLLQHSDNLSKALQGSHVSAAKGQAVAMMTVKALELLRQDDMFSLS